MKNKNAGIGHVSLVGAGCGSKEWITVEGLALLRSCDVVVYDDLIDATLLHEVPPQAERIYVGKRSHRSSAKQEDIQSILVDRARQNQHVVRLKGGDPFVFGRGGEEIQALNEHGIPWNVVPGISSALAIPAEAGIPVTHRGVSRSLHIMTAHTREDVLRRDMEQFARLEGTLIFLMGLESLGTIVSVLIENGRDKHTPAAILSGGNTLHRCKVTGTLENIAEKAREEGVVTPAVIVVGEVVALDLQKDAVLPLSDVRIGLTGTDDFQAKLRDRLQPFGAKPVSMMRGRCTELAAVIPWEEIIDGKDKWIVFTSVQGIRNFFLRCKEARIDHRAFTSCKFAVIGSATGKALEGYGFIPDLCPKEYTSPALAEELLLQVKEGEKVYLFSSKQGTNLLTERLLEKQVDYQRFDVYDTEFVCDNRQMEALEYILFGSAGGVKALFRSGYQMGKTTRGICIGKICADAFRECFQKEPIVAVSATVEAMLQALLETVKDSEG
ncbi:uroporphyrinogen-III C-methyltransferase [Bariatricus sp. SGI.154]|uniref:uroporphyrinogen-III C-methyltransferase n=1 Tax=Bariatricus sp. SGI.154 TaxID=3420549 RepID=UPI003CFF4A9F